MQKLRSRRRSSSSSRSSCSQCTYSGTRRRSVEIVAVVVAAGRPRRGEGSELDGVLDIETSDLVVFSGDNDEAYDESFYRRLAASHRSLVPSIMFFHVPLVEYAGASSQKSTPLRIGSVYRDYVGCSDVDSHLFSALRDYGDVKATFVGHAHLNDFCYKRGDEH
ncbi:hypothetical protein PINS_up016460 [Pythium insidiosum]|nr:hypothetical protein PINS_up016460 [Pythium insidiosum]